MSHSVKTQKVSERTSMNNDTCIDTGDGLCEGPVYPRPAWMGSDFRPWCDRHYNRYAAGLWRQFTS